MCKWSSQLLIFLVSVIYSLAVYAEPDIRMLTEHGPPGAYEDESGHVTGATAEMVRELMRRQNLSAKIQLKPWKRVYLELQQGPRVALFETTRTEEREKLFKWVGPIKKVIWGFYAKKGSAIQLKTLDDAKKVSSVCTYLGDSRTDYLQAEGFTNLNIPPLPTQCINMLLAGRVDLWISSNMGYDAMLNDTGIDGVNFELLHVVGTKYLYIAFSKDVPDLEIDSWQQTYNKMKTDGTLRQYYEGVYPENVILDMISSEVPSFSWLLKQ